jgi:hypothetical protein
MAREACDKDKVDPWHRGFWTITQEELERFAALVSAAEREECAKVAENYPNWNELKVNIAAAIRARLAQQAEPVREWVPLTDEQISDAWNEEMVFRRGYTYEDFKSAARRLDAALKEKNYG